jgi:hypothetical protein
MLCINVIKVLKDLVAQDHRPISTTTMDLRAPSAGLLSLPNEMLFQVAYELKDPLALCNVSLVCRGLRYVFQEALLTHIETLYDMNDHLLALLEQIYLVTLATPATRTTQLRGRVEQVTCQVRSLKTARDKPYIDSTWPKDETLGDKRLPFYTELVNTAGTLSSSQKKYWLKRVVVGKDFALMQILFSILPQLHTLEIEKTLAMLPRQDFLVRTGAFQNLRKLKLSGFSKEPLTTAFYGLMAFPKLRELEFSDLYMDAEMVSKVPQISLNITTLHFIHCYVSIGVLDKLITACPSLEAFTYELGRAHWDDRRRSADFNALTIKEALFGRKHTLTSITILNRQVLGMKESYAIGSLSMFTALMHLCVNQTFLMPTLRNGDFDLSPGNDLGYHLLNLPPTVRTLELHYCMEYISGALDRLAKRLAARPTELKVIKVRFRRTDNGPLPELVHQGTQHRMDQLEQAFGAIGVTLRTCVVTSMFQQ